jgi:alpha-tubulin suppressor-like RCC1 family protein
MYRKPLFVLSSILIGTSLIIGNFTLPIFAATTTREVMTWGDDYFKTLGNGIREEEVVPVSIANFSDVKMIKCSGYSCMAVKNNGTLWAWGDNGYNEFGNGTNIASDIPIQIGSDTDWLTVDGGEVFSLAVKTNGTIWTSGGDTNNPTYDPAVAPTTLTQISSLSNIKSVAAHYFHALALDNNGNVFSWGQNRFGALGINNSNTNLKINTPTQIPGLTNVKSICAGYNSSMAVTTTGEVYEWGFKYGESSPTSTTILVPTLVNIANVDEIACGYFNKMALTNDGKVYTWGNGYLGDGVTSDSPIPVQASLSNIVSISGGWDVNFASDTNGEVWSWGDANGNTMGLGLNNNDQELPIKNPLLNGVLKVVAHEAGGFAIYNQYGSINGTLLSNQNSVLEGVTVELVDGTNTVIQTTITDEDGNYSFDNVLPGEYNIRSINANILYPELENTIIESIQVSNGLTVVNTTILSIKAVPTTEPTDATSETTPIVKNTHGLIRTGGF